MRFRLRTSLVGNANRAHHTRHLSTYVVGVLLCIQTGLCCSALAQKSGGSIPSPQPRPAPPPRAPTDTFDENELRYGKTKAVAPTNLGESDTCFFPPLNGLRSPVAVVANLQAPAKAKKEYAAACAALNDKKFDAVEQHLRKAVQVDAKYPAAWVTLGQLLAQQQKNAEAKQACGHALEADASYVAAHLCIADVAARTGQWDQVLKSTGRAIELDPANDAPGYAYSAMANLNLRNLPEAERDALRALEIDRTNSDPRVHFLLAQIYEAKKDPENEAAQLREYLKYASTPEEANMVKQALADLEKRAGK